MSVLDSVKLAFSTEALVALNFLLALVIFGIALDIRATDFRKIVTRPRALLVGLAGQIIVLPAVTLLWVWLMQPSPSLALGLILVAACPGGTVSNFFVKLAGANVALSVSMSSVSSLVAAFVTPLSVAFWGSRLATTRELLTSIEISFWHMFLLVLCVLIVPTIIGCVVASRFTAIASRLRRPLRLFSVGVFVAFIVIAFAANWSIFLAYFEKIYVLVVGHNLLALCSGYALASIFGLSQQDRRTVSIEVGIQNTALGLTLVFTFFDALGGMALIAGAWGIWHLISGSLLASYWARKPIKL